MWVSAAAPGVSQFLHRSNGDIVVDAIGFVVRATLKEHTGSPVVGTLRCSPGAWHAAARRAHGGVGHNQDRRGAASKRSGFDGTGRAARRLRSGRKPCMPLRRFEHCRTAPVVWLVEGSERRPLA